MTPIDVVRRFLSDGGVTDTLFVRSRQIQVALTPQDTIHMAELADLICNYFKHNTMLQTSKEEQFSTQTVTAPLCHS